MFAAPPLIETRVFSRVPEKLRMRDRQTEWTRGRGAAPVHSFLEGPSFDRAGNLYCVDIPHGRIFRVSPQGEWDVFAEYDGHPNGLKIHKDGRIFVADAKVGLLCFDPATGKHTTVLDRAGDTPFSGLNDLVFADNGDLYFTDPGEHGLEKLSGRVFRLRSTGELDLLMSEIPVPNGIVLSPQQDALFVAVTRSNHVLRTLLKPRFPQVFKTGVFVQMSGGLAGPDGMAVDEAGNLAVVHAGFGSVWLFSHLGEPLARLKSCTGIRTTNIAYGGADRKKLYIMEAEQGAILEAQMEVPGQLMYSHQ